MVREGCESKHLCSVASTSRLLLIRAEKKKKKKGKERERWVGFSVFHKLTSANTSCGEAGV